MDKLVDHLFVFEGDGKIKDYLGKYTDYRNDRKELEEQAKVKPKKVEVAKPVVKEQPKTKFSYKEKLEFETLEKEIPKLEEQKEKLNEQLVNSVSDHEELMKLTQKLGYVTAQLEEKTDRWLTLSEFA
jgi:ATP-binding cassette subfamily F protein uup